MQYEIEFNNAINSIGETYTKNNYIQKVVSLVDEHYPDHTSTIATYRSMNKDALNEIQSYNNQYTKYKTTIANLSLNEDNFLFPNGDAATIRNTQLIALKHVNNIITAHDEIEAWVDFFETKQDELTQENKEEFSVQIEIKQHHTFNELKSAISKSLPEHIASSYAKELENNLITDTMPYEQAIDIERALKNHGLQCAIVSETTKDISQNVLDNMQSKENEKLNAIAQKCGRHHIIYQPEMPHKAVWALVGLIWLITWGAALLCLLFQQEVNFLVMFLIAPGLVGITYLIYGIICLRCKIKNISPSKLNKEETAFATQICQEVSSKLKSSSSDWEFDVYTAIDEQVLTIAYKRHKQFSALVDTIINNMNYLLDVWTKRLDEINYMPAGLAVDIIPKIIELMESGMAADYQTAAWKAEQDRKNEELLQMQMEANRRQEEEWQRQREEQERYEQERLEEIREHNRRAEAFAREQAEQTRQREETLRQETLRQKQAQERKEQREAFATAMKERDESNKAMHLCWRCANYGYGCDGGIPRCGNYRAK